MRCRHVSLTDNLVGKRMKIDWQHVLTHFFACLVYIAFVNTVWAQNVGDRNSGAHLPGGPGPPANDRARNSGNGQRQAGVCRDGWFDGLIYNVDTQPVPVCLYINVNPLSWTQARDTCRNDYGFLLKLESPVHIAGTHLIEYLKQRFIHRIWTGIHEEEEHLVWDELTPYQVRPRNDYMEAQVVADRGWQWDDEVPDDLESVCGELDMTSQLHDRTRRAVEDNPDSADPDIMFPPLSREADQGSVADKPFSRHFQSPQASNPASRQLQQNTNQNADQFGNLSGGALRVQANERTTNFGNLPGRRLGTNPSRHPSRTSKPVKSGNNGLGHGAGPQFDTFDHMSRTSNQAQGQPGNGNGDIDRSEQDIQSDILGTKMQGGDSNGHANQWQTQHPNQNPTSASFTNPSGLFNNQNKQTSMGQGAIPTADTGSAEFETIPTNGAGIDASLEEGLSNKHAPVFSSPDSAESVSESNPSAVSVTISQEVDPNGPSVGSRPEEDSRESTNITTSIQVDHAAVGESSEAKVPDLAINIGHNSNKNGKNDKPGKNNGNSNSGENTNKSKEPSTDSGENSRKPKSRTDGSEEVKIDLADNSGEVLPTKAAVDLTGNGQSEEINISNEPRKEAQSDEEIRKKTSTEVESPGTIGGMSAEDDIPDMEEVVDPAEEVSRERVGRKNQMQLMKLSSCRKRLPSVCFSYPISVAQKASSCEEGWYGHVFVDRCYRIVSKVTFQEAQRTCEALGGTLAERSSQFYKKLIFMAFHLDGSNGNGVNFWVNPKPSERGCIAMSEMRTGQQNCNRKFDAVCQKTAQKQGVHGQYVESHVGPTEDDDSSDKDSKESKVDGETSKETQDIQETAREVKFSIGAKTTNVLKCDLSSNATEFPTQWYKDGVLVDIKYRRMAGGVAPIPRGSGLPLSPLPEPAAQETTSLEFDALLRTTLAFAMSNRKITVEMFQGKYWCEVWDTEPFVRRRSQPYFVRYTDVMTFLGSIRVDGISKQEEMLFNMMSKGFQEIKGAESDISVLYNTISSDLHRAIPNLDNVLTFSKRVESDPGLLEYFSFLKLSKDYSDEEEERTLEVLSRLLKRTVLNMTMSSSFAGIQAPAMLPTLALKSTVACPRQTMKDEDTGLGATFPRTKLQKQSVSVEICQQLPVGVAHCNGNYDTGAYWDDVTVTRTCELPTAMMHPLRITDKLTEMSEIEIDDDNVEDILEETADIVEEALELRSDDVSHLADIIEHSMKAKKMNKKMGQNILRTMNKLIDADEDEVAKANIMDFAANRIIRSVEEFAQKAELDKDNKLRMVTPNVALEIWNLDSDMVPVIGLAAKALTGSNSHTTPFEDTRIATIYNRSQIHEIDLDAAIEIPQSLVKKTASGDKRLYMMVYRRGKLFEAAAASYVTEHGTSHASDLGILNSFVISASIGKQKIEGLEDRVKTIFRPLEDGKGTPRICAFWDFSLHGNRGGWSRKGCTYNGTVNGRDICLCDHLTNFAVLLDFYGQSEPIPEHHEITLSVITLIGLSLSILGLALTIISFVFFKKLRQGRAQQTLFNLAVALLCSWLVFLTGIRQTHNFYGCMVVSILLHYFILASFMWMLMEAVLQYLTFVKVLGTYIHRFTLKTSIPAWGLPLVPIIVVVSIDYKLYVGGEIYCWMARPAFIYGFAIPSGLIILCNLVIFIITIFSICRRPNGLRSNQSKYKMAITNLQAAVTSFILLGLTWVFGYLAISDARLTFQYIFTILNTLQGFFIFILFVARKKQVRDQWIMLCCKQRERDKASRTLSASNSIPSSISGGNPRTDRSDSTRTTTSFINSSYDSIYLGSQTKQPQYRNF